MKKNLFLVLTVVLFGFIHLSYVKADSVRDELREDLEGLYNWASNNLMPRSKKDLQKGHIDGDTRDIVKKIHANSHWLRGHMISQINEGWSMNQIRDDYEQEEHYRDLYELTREAMERTDNRDAEKLNEMLIRFNERFVLPIGEIVGYRMHGKRRYNEHSRERYDNRHRRDNW